MIRMGKKAKIVNCEDCLYCYVPADPFENEGQCRKYPPKVFVFKEEHSFNREITVFPEVKFSDWCGEGKQK